MNRALWRKLLQIFSPLNGLRYILAPGSLILVLGLSACFKSDPSATLSSDTIRIGEVGSMTGSDATFGLSTHRGILLAIDEINLGGGVRGKKLELITKDDRGQPSEAVLSMNHLITQQKVEAVLGEVASTLTIAMAPLAGQFKIPLVSPSSINTKVTQQNEYVFRVCFGDRFQAQVMADFALKNIHAKRAAILQDVKSDYSRDSADLFTEIFKKAGGEVVIVQTYSAGDIDFKSQLTAIRTAQPDVLLVPGYYTEIGLIARQKKELGIHAPMLGGDGWDSPKLREIGGESLNGSYFVSHFAQNDSSQKVKSFVEQYKATYKIGSPDGLAALGYDAAWVLADALRRAKSSSSSDLKAALESTQYTGVTGQISIGASRNTSKSAVVFLLAPDGSTQAVTTIAP